MTENREALPRPSGRDCAPCAALRQMTHDGKARTYSISVGGVFQAPIGKQDEIVDAVMDGLHCFTGGWTVTELPDDEQIEYEAEERRECGEPDPEGSGKVCRRICAPGRDYHGGGHWFADPELDGEHVRQSTARWIVTGQQPPEAGA